MRLSEVIACLLKPRDKQMSSHWRGYITITKNEMSVSSISKNRMLCRPLDSTIKSEIRKKNQKIKPRINWEKSSMKVLILSLRLKVVPNWKKISNFFKFQSKIQKLISRLLLEILDLELTKVRKYHQSMKV